jgi:hypothetical protein
MLSWLNNVDSFTLAHARSYEFAFSVISGIVQINGLIPGLQSIWQFKDISSHALNIRVIVLKI